MQWTLDEREIRGWTDGDAFRELYLFWKDAIAESFGLDGGFIQTHRETADSIFVTATAREVSGYLGFIEFSKKTGRVSLVAADAHLLSTNTAEAKVKARAPDVTNEDLFTFRNPRLKLAALYLNRDGHQVSIIAWGRFWLFPPQQADSPLLCETGYRDQDTLVGSQREQEAKPLLVMQARESKDVAIFLDRDTNYVTRLTFALWMGMAFDIRGVTDSWNTITTDYGDILFYPRYANKLFLEGVRLPETTLGKGVFQYGYNFRRAPVSASRRSLIDSQAEAQQLCNIWNVAIEQQHDDALRRYAHLHLDKPQALELRGANDHLTESTVKAVWTYLRRMDGGNRFYGNNFYYAGLSPNVSHIQRPTLIWLAC
ncbi:hypothetical protein ASPACDRAFT_47782 [Aspergillus aculeatus ATCC 16872]|uniref:Uncharacterized protein n=1 Tax=Aspergillus aculeatus (strain ATCC 16872 / CBS 172.66 / WB 5094) TaxID=690307 RepID=A0A1L9WGZ1_ASPA1|nr:uncharacterized protein ASPACDRAFT_47782 [Aspergillus aculeatus ATCC 16872]OJJ95430.1 hypothetical protein ASPACDRAFT_47782 [Aspergillus aculeatus ATCC 16872]